MSKMKTINPQVVLSSMAKALCSIYFIGFVLLQDRDIFFTCGAFFLKDVPPFFCLRLNSNGVFH